MDDQLSDEQCQNLLDVAKERLKLKSASDCSNNSPNVTDGDLQPPLPETHFHLPSTLDSGLPSYIQRTSKGTRFKPGFLVSKGERDLVDRMRHVGDQVLAKTNAEKDIKATAGPNWYNIPKTSLTPELKRDLQLIRLRSILDPKRHYKKVGSKNQFPEFSQVGTIIQGPTEFFSARIPNKDRKSTFIQDVLATEASTNQFGLMYNDIQKAKMSGKKAHYKNLKFRRKSRFRELSSRRPNKS